VLEQAEVEVLCAFAEQSPTDWDLAAAAVDLRSGPSISDMLREVGHMGQDLVAGAKSLAQLVWGSNAGSTSLGEPLQPRGGGASTS
jgi:hypothetical protein